MDYAKSGVSIAAGEAVVKGIKPAILRTHTPGVLSEIGLFGGLFDARFPEYSHPVLVASADGVGTKLKVAILANKHNTVGRCLVNHCVNDILACGAKPLFFLDYFATGKLDPSIAAEVIVGLANACEENGCALLGGETAEMPSMYADGDYDIAGTIVGVVDKERILNGSKVEVGDVLIALPSSGLHTNGYSLARAVLLEKYSVHDYIPELGGTLADALLAVHRSYLKPVYPLLNDQQVNGISHITGGGIVGNTVRILQAGQQLEIDWNSWEQPPIFSLIQRTGSISMEAMREAFNLGVGMILVVSPANAHTVLANLASEHPFVIGRIARSAG